VRKSILGLGASVLAMAIAATANAASEAPTPGAFTLVVMPDTQNYADYNASATRRSYFKVQTEWVAANVDKHNIKYVLTLGDIVQHNDPSEWPIARDAYDVLQNAGVPYSLTAGNHDYGPGGNGSNHESLFNEDQFFGPNSPYAQQSSVGGFFGDPGKTDNSWHTFEAGGKKWMSINLEWAPRDIILQRAEEIIEAHPDHNVIITTHAYLFNTSARYNGEIGSQDWNPKNYGVNNLSEKPNDGQDMWDELVKRHANIKLIMNGHVLNDGNGFLKSVGADGQIVNEYLTNFQMKTDGGQSWLTLLEFQPDGETVQVKTYNPYLDTYNREVDQEFTLTLTDKRVGADHAQQTLDLKPRLYLQPMAEVAVSRPWGEAVANFGTLGPVADAQYSGAGDKPYKFDGESALTVRGGVAPLRKWTVAGWVRATSDTVGQSLVEMTSSQGQGLKIDVQPAEGDAGGNVWTAAFGAGASTKAKVQDRRAVNPYNWYHLAVTYADGSLKFYVDGTQVAQQDGLGNGLSLGMTKPVIGKGLDGEVGEFAVFDHALGYGELSQIYLAAYHRVVAGNLLNENPTIDANNAAPVTVIEQAFPGISVTNTNRGDHELFLGNALQNNPRTSPTLGRPAIAGDGVMMASVRQNNRDGLPISVEVGWNSFSGGVLSLATADVGNTIANSPKENNVNSAVAWFPFGDGWTAGHVNREGVLVNANTATPEMFKYLPLGEPGRIIADFGVNALSDGLLFTVGANNSNYLTAATPREGGAGWDIKLVSNTNGLGTAGDFSFLYLRSSLEGLIAGSFDGGAGESTRSYGDFEAIRLETGKYRIAVPGETPESGMLILSAADVANVVAVSYQADAEGGFVVQTIDPVTAQPVDGAFNWAFVSFEDPIEFTGSDDLGEPNIALPDDQFTPPIDPLDFATACIDTYTPQEDRDSIYSSIENGTGVSITGNGWKRLVRDYTVTENTMLEFDFRSRSEGEVTGIGFDTQDFMTASLSFKVYGTQAWGNMTYDNYSGNGAWQHYTIPVGQFYTGEFSRLFFVNDKDGAPLTTNEADFRDIMVYEAGQEASAQPITFERCDVKSHGGTQQDFATYEIQESGEVLKIVGNGRKRADVDYLITPNTVIEFEFKSTDDMEPEVAAIGMDDNNAETEDRSFKVFGAQAWGNMEYDNYEGNGEWKSYVIPVGQYYTGLMHSIYFINDDDRPSPQTEAFWRNVRVYESPVTN